MMKYKPQYFKLSEFACKCCGTGKPSALLILWLDLTRRAYQKPIIVNSGYRCPKHNAEVKGAAFSRHLIGCAADIRPLDPEDLTELKRMAHLLFAMANAEVIDYATFVHVAVPRSAARYVWNGGEIEIKC